MTLSSKWDYLKSQNMTDSEIESMGVDEDDAFLGVSGMSSGSSGIDRLVGPMAWEDRSTTVRGRLGSGCSAIRFDWDSHRF